MDDIEKILGIRKAARRQTDIEKLLSQVADTEIRYNPKIENPFERKPVGIFKTLDLLNRGQYAVLNPLRRLTDSKSYSPTEYAKAIWDGLVGKERSSTTDVLENFGWKPKDTTGKILRGAVGFAGDVLLDPLTYLGFLGLTNAGKAAKAGAALKMGDALLDMRKAEDAAKVTDRVIDLMTKAGKPAEEISKAKDAFKGIKSATLAEDAARLLAENGDETAKAVKLGKNWLQQYREGQRALLQLQAPFTNVAKRIPIVGDKGEEAFFGGASKLGKRVGAARLATNQDVQKATSAMSDTVRKAAKKGEAIRIGKGEWLDLTDDASLDKLKSLLGEEDYESVLSEARKIAEGSRGVKSKERSVAQELSSMLLERFPDAESGMKQAYQPEALAKVAKGWEPVGRTINTLADAFNFIATPLKKIKRFASGTSKATGNEATENIVKLIGKDGEKLKADTKEFEEVIGGVVKKLNANDDIVARCEAIECLTHPAVWDDLVTKANAKGWENITVDDIVDSLETLKAGSERNKASQYYIDLLAEFEEMAKNKSAAKPMFGIDASTVERAQRTLKRWNNVSDIHDIGTATRYAQDMMEKMGGVTGEAIKQREKFEGFGYIPHLLDESNPFTKESRISHHGQTIFEANQGIRSKESIDNLIYNVNRTLKLSGERNITGADVLGNSRAKEFFNDGGRGVNIRKTQSSLQDDIEERLAQNNELQEASKKIYSDYNENKKQMEALYRELADAGLPEEEIERLVREQINSTPKIEFMDGSTREIEDLIQENKNIIADNIQQIADNKKQYALLQKQFDDELEAIKKEYETVRATAFSPDLKKNLLTRITAAQNKYSNILTAEGAIRFGTQVRRGVEVPNGYVMLNEIVPSGFINDLKATYDNADSLIARMEQTAVPASYVNPLREMFSLKRDDPGVALKTYDWALSILKPFMLSAPSTQVRNTLSSFSMAWAGGDFRTLQQQKNFAKVAKFISTGGRMGADAIVDIGGKNYTISYLWDLLGRYGGDDIDIIAREYMAKPEVELLNKFAQGTRKGTEKITKYAEKWAEKTERTFRLTHFINRLQQGYSVEDAIESVAQHFYDYGDLSKFEERVMRRVFPFYTFWRKNTEANVRYLLTNAGYANAPLKLANELNQMTEGEEGTFPMEWLENERQQWLANQGAFRWPIGKSIGTMQGILPQADLANVLSPKDITETAAGMLTPVLKVPFEQAINKDLFTGRPIVDPMRPSTYFLGVPTPPRLVHAIRPFRIMHTIDNLVRTIGSERARSYGVNVPLNEDMTLGEKAGSAARDVFGFRTYLQDPESVQLNKRLEVAKLIRQFNQYLDKHPNLAPGYRKDIEKNLTVLKEELGRTANVGETEEQLMKGKQKRMKRKKK